MGKPINPEEIAELVRTMDAYVITPSEENLRTINENLNKLGESIEWAKLYLDAKKENGLKPYAERLFESAKRFLKYIKTEKKQIDLQRIDIFSSPYSVDEQLKRKS